MVTYVHFRRPIFGIKIYETSLMTGSNNFCSCNVVSITIIRFMKDQIN